ncbi:MAG: ABC transporter ATP-binding protein [Actinomycetales bacterium]|nr:ABC transporter ATP-binding protein [Actinomycetales bacterium]
MHTERRDSLKERFIRGRSRGHHTFQALDGVSFTIPRGQTYALIGHNGSGKSTMLKLLAGVLRPDSGDVIADGRISALLELGAGFHGELTGRENIYLNAAILGLTRRETEQAIDRIIDFADIGEFIDAPVKTYSSGMYLRLGFAIAVTVDPQILIIDEIIAVGDEQFQRKCFDYLHSLRRKGTTIVLVSHALGIVEEMCEGAIWLDHGRMRKVGPAREIVRLYLDEVNATEIKLASEAAGADAPDATEEADASPARGGSGEVRVTDLEFVSAAGVVAPVLLTGERATFRLHYEARKPLEDVVFGLGFFTETGINVAGPNSGSGLPPVPVLAGRGTVDFQVERLTLSPGSYGVSTAVVSHSHTFDYIDRGFQLAVRGSAGGEPGLARMFGGWSAGPATVQPESSETSRSLDPPGQQPIRRPSEPATPHPTETAHA